MARLEMAPFTITLACVTLRGLQLVCAVVALTTTVMAFPTGSSDGQRYHLGSAEATFLVLVAYTIGLHAIAFLVLVELFPVLLRPDAMLTRPTDALLALLTLSGAGFLVTSDYMRSCDQYWKLVNCSNLTAATVFAVLSALPPMGSIALTFVRPVTPRLAAMHSNCTQSQGGNYHVGETPMSSSCLVSSVGNHNIVAA